MIVRIDKTPNKTYSCTYVSGEITLEQIEDRLYFHTESILFGPEVDLSDSKARDFVQAWVEEKLLEELAEYPTTRYARVLKYL